MASTDVTCYGITRGADWQQEMYETASRHAGRRARQLRKAGHRVSVGALGWQVTRVGRVKMTMLTIHQIHCDTHIAPPSRIVSM